MVPRYNQATMILDPGVVGDTGVVSVLREDARDVDLLTALIEWYGRLPVERTAFLASVVRALVALAEVYPLEGIRILPVVAGDQARGVEYRWRGAEGNPPMRWVFASCPQARATPPRTWLTTLERIGQAVLTCDVHFGAHEPQWDPEQYAAWSDGGRPTGKPPPPRYRARGPSRVTPLFRLLECHRRIAGAVGVYWLLPMMYAMATTTAAAPPIVVDVRVPCAAPHQRSGLVLCDGLPGDRVAFGRRMRPAVGCQVRYHWWPRRAWTSHEPLVSFLLFHQCHILSGEFGSWRRYYGTRGDAFFPVSPATDALVVVTVGGVAGPPVATAGLQSQPPNGWYISALCAVTRSGGGTTLVRHLQSHNRTLWADATGTSVDFYLRLGFAAPDPREPLHLRWPAHTTAIVAR